VTAVLVANTTAWDGGRSVTAAWDSVNVCGWLA
jgi:hypothetical protein